MAEKRSYKQYSVTAEQFITTWQMSDTAADVAAKLEMPLKIIHARASNYRKAGIRLKQMPRRSNKIDVEAFNRLIEGLDRQRARE